MSEERNARKVYQGRVVSDKMDKCRRKDISYRYESC